ncbi:hypothetical protein SRHO_G00260580 [Serrasalmus rhombeus]
MENIKMNAVFSLLSSALMPVFPSTNTNAFLERIKGNCGLKYRNLLLLYYLSNNTCIIFTTFDILALLNGNSSQISNEIIALNDQTVLLSLTHMEWIYTLFFPLLYSSPCDQ